MEIKLKKSTYLSLIFLVITLAAYLAHNYLESDYYRRLRGYIVWYVFYPSFFLSIFFSFRSFYIMKQSFLMQKKWVFLNLLSVIFATCFIIKILYVMTTPV